MPKADLPRHVSPFFHALHTPVCFFDLYKHRRGTLRTGQWHGTPAVASDTFDAIFTIEVLTLPKGSWTEWGLYARIARLPSQDGFEPAASGDDALQASPDDAKLFLIELARAECKNLSVKYERHSASSHSWSVYTDGTKQAIYGLADVNTLERKREAQFTHQLMF
jgi:hypothetical protein